MKLLCVINQIQGDERLSQMYVPGGQQGICTYCHRSSKDSSHSFFVMLHPIDDGFKDWLLRIYLNIIKFGLDFSPLLDLEK